MSENALNTPEVHKGIEIVGQATQADAAGDDRKAVELYKQACKYFMESIRSLSLILDTTLHMPFIDSHFNDINGDYHV